MNKVFLQIAGVAAQGATAQADISTFAFLNPIFVFLLVFVVMFALLKKTKVLGEHLFFDVSVSFLIAIMFASFGAIREVVLAAVPWFAVLGIAVFFILAMVGFVSDSGAPKKLLVWGSLIIIVIMFVVILINGFFANVVGYLPGAYFGFNTDPQVLFFFDWFYSPRVIGAFWLIVAAAVTGFFLMRSK